MNNLIRSEIYKLIRSRVFKNSCIVMSLVTIIVVFSKYIIGENTRFNLTHCRVGGRSYGFTISSTRDMISIEYLYNALGAIGIILIISIFIAGTSVVNEYISGTIKNSIAYGHNRISIYLSKVIASSSVVMSITTIFIIICIVGCTIVYGWGEPVTFNRISEIVRIIILVNIVLTCFISINMCLAFMIRSKALLVVVYMIINFLTVMSIANGISPIIRFNPLFMLMDICSKVPTIELMGTYTVNCLGLIAGSSLVGAIFFKNQDIK
ncbi:ABC transporter permease subunit [Oceanirhabdus sp. W0125-5]|uniref:ABC transporter permease subunit n=1 Tax=Oceanirhabdus sp. W0125-5 TaxID=2999116 RepID=UPI0022F2FA21|nr:ABC transporter permease subunit [Oceanirhabdus sp. W0125-5]WBW97419.1 ABC transporter permease subunit [Oceanirhabdus sp. W0125-5]